MVMALAETITRKEECLDLKTIKVDDLNNQLDKELHNALVGLVDTYDVVGAYLEEFTATPVLAETFIQYGGKWIAGYRGETLLHSVLHVYTVSGEVHYRAIQVVANVDITTDKECWLGKEEDSYGFLLGLRKFNLELNDMFRDTLIMSNGVPVFIGVDSLTDCVYDFYGQGVNKPISSTYDRHRLDLLMAMAMDDMVVDGRRWVRSTKMFLKTKLAKELNWKEFSKGIYACRNAKTKKTMIVSNKFLYQYSESSNTFERIYDLHSDTYDKAKVKLDEKGCVEAFPFLRIAVKGLPFGNFFFTDTKKALSEWYKYM